MSLRYQVTKVKDMKNVIPLNFQNTTSSGGKKETKAMVFHKIVTEEISDRFVAPCFVNGLEAYDGEINLGVEENMISNEFAVKLCLEHEVKRGNKVVKKELIVALRGEIYFVKFIINPEEDDVELDDLDFRDIPYIKGVDVPQFVCKMGKSSRNKRKQLIYSDIGPSMSTGTPLAQEEAEREALAISIYERYSILEEERRVIETMAYSDKYKKILDGICLDKRKLDGINKEEEEAIIKIKGEALIEKDDPGAFVIPIRIEGKINLNALVDTGSDIIVIPYRIYKELGRKEVQNVKKGISMLNHSKAEPMGLLSNVLCQVGVTTIIAKFLVLDMLIDRDTPIIVGREFLHTCGSILNKIDTIMSTFDGICHQTFRAAKTSLDTAKSDSDDEEDDPLDRSLALQEVMNPFRKICVWKKVVSFLGSLPVALQHVEWKPNYTGCFNKKEDRDGQWHTMGTHDDEAGSSRPKRSRQYETVEEVLLPQVHHVFLEWEGCKRDAKSRIGCGDEIDGMLRINLCEARPNEEIFTSVAWIRAFNINEPIYSELCHEFYSTYEFDEVCADDE
ncbi:ribonuclease H-like domain-containing protein [Tanacetum coccineum]